MRERITAFWRRRSLRFWLTTGMAMTFVPMFTAAVVGYFFNHRIIIRPLVEVSSQYRDVLHPLQSMQLSLFDLQETVDDFAIDGEVRRISDYRREATKIDTAFIDLGPAVESRPWLRGDVADVHNEWRAVASLSDAIMFGPTLGGMSIVGERVEAFVHGVNQLGHGLSRVYDDVRLHNVETHDQALADLQRWDRWVLAGFIISILGAIMGVIVINGSLVSSMDQLTNSALRVATGEREHQIEVHVPQELANVADAFNVMTTRIRQQEEALAHVARTDGLTGLNNRREFDRLLVEELGRAERYGRPVSLVMGDIDHFKHFNDTHGHQAGDEVLRTVADTLKAGMRTTDKACRFGGEEFAMILTETDAGAGRQLAERLREAVEAHEVTLDGTRSARVTISLGVATYPACGKTSEALLKSADTALYECKEQGRNRVVLASCGEV